MSSRPCVRQRVRRFDEADHLHLAATLGTTQWVHFIDSLDQHRPHLAAAEVVVSSVNDGQNDQTHPRSHLRRRLFLNGVIRVRL